MATSYTSDKKIGALDPITGTLSSTDELVVNKNGDILKAEMSDVEAFVFASKSQETPQTGDVVVIRRGTDIRQLVTQNMIPNGAIANTQIATNAAIAHSKLATMPSASVMLGSASNVPTATAVSGDVTISNTGVTAIAAGAIVNDDVNASAAIAGTKIAPNFGSQNVQTTGTLAAGNTTITGTAAVSGNSTVGGTLGVTGLLTATGGVSGNLTGDVTGNVTGNLTGPSTSCSGNAATATKLSSARSFELTGAVTGTVSSDLTSGATIATSFGGTGIVNANVASNAAIAGTKIAPNFGSQNISTTGTLAAGATTITGALTASGDITAFSDGRLKECVETIHNALEKVNMLRGVSYIKDGKASIGVIAQEVQQVIPEVVADGEYLSVAYGNLVGLLIEAVKELSSKIDALK